LFRECQSQAQRKPRRERTRPREEARPIEPDPGIRLGGISVLDNV